MGVYAGLLCVKMIKNDFSIKPLKPKITVREMTALVHGFE